MSDEPAWIAPLRSSVTGTTKAPDVEVLRGAQPSLLAADTVHAITSLLLAALIVAAAILRSELASGALDVIALLLRSASVAFVLRALAALLRFWLRVGRDRKARAWALAWSADGLYLQTPHGEHAVASSDVLDVVGQAQRTTRASFASLEPLYLVLRPERTPSYLVLPPYFTASSDVLAARLERWLRARATAPLLAREVANTNATDALHGDALQPEQRYRRAAQGTPHVGDVVVPEGTRYRRRAPYGALLGLVFVADALQAAGPLRTRLLPASLLTLVLVFGALIGWFGWMRRRRVARLGIALLITPRELLVRGAHGVVALGHTELTEIEVQTRLTWSPYAGSYVIRTLWLAARDGTRLAFDEDFLGVPAVVLAKLEEAYRADASRVMPASQGSGAGAGISERAGTAATATTRT